MNTNENNKFLPVAVIVAGLFIAGAVVWNGQNPAAPSDGTAQAPKVNVKDVKIDGDPFIGRADAPVTIISWSDFQCPYCKKFEFETLPGIIENYVDTGKVKVVFMDFTFLGSDSIDAALYNRSVWKLYPEQYFAWRTAMFTAQDDEGDQGFGDAASIDKLNTAISGIDAEKVSADVKANTNAYQKEVNADKAEAQKVGVNSTPSSIIGTQVVAGAYPFEYFKPLIDELLK